MRLLKDLHKFKAFTRSGVLVCRDSRNDPHRSEPRRVGQQCAHYRHQLRGIVRIGDEAEAIPCSQNGCVRFLRGYG